MSCGVPQAIAPQLFDDRGQDHCYVRRQPQSEVELDAMVRVIRTQESTCIRYGGADPAILRRLAEAGEADKCDQPGPPGVGLVRRDHVRFATTPGPTAWTAIEILERLVAANPLYRARPWEGASRTSASVSVCWYEDHYHRIDAFLSEDADVWIIRHHGPAGLSDSIHDWLVQDPAFEAPRWQTREQSDADGAWSATPW